MILSTPDWFILFLKRKSYRLISRQIRTIFFSFEHMIPGSFHQHIIGIWIEKDNGRLYTDVSIFSFCSGVFEECLCGSKYVLVSNCNNFFYNDTILKESVICQISLSYPIACFRNGICCCYILIGNRCIGIILRHT